MDEHGIVRVVGRRLPEVPACTLLFQHEQVEPLRNVGMSTGSFNYVRSTPSCVYLVPRQRNGLVFFRLIEHLADGMSE
jgi:hypothetical protein